MPSSFTATILTAAFIIVGNAIFAAATTTEQPNLTTVDISQETDRHAIIAAGTESIYQGHPTSLLMPNGKTMFVVWTHKHGGICGPMARSDDAGKTWIRMDKELPRKYRKHKNCPAIYRMVDAAGKERLWIVSSCKEEDVLMPRLLSEDGGKTWREYEPIGYYGVMPICSILQSDKPGKYLAFFQTRIDADGNLLKTNRPTPTSTFRVMQTVTTDGGQTWSEPTKIFNPVTDPSPIEGVTTKPCEPFVVRSPDDKELCCIIRDNSRKGNSLMCFSRDEGKTWSEVVETPWGLTGDRHCGVCTKDGRWVIAFRDMAHGSKTYGHFVAWVGTYDDIKNRKPGQYRIKLLHNYAGWDCGYPGVMRLDDDSIVALTYLKYWPGKKKHSVVATKFHLPELDDRLKKN